MIFSNLLLVCGSAVLTWGLHSFGHPLLRRLGTLGVFVTSFLAGWLLGGHWWLGAVFASSWLFLPWVEIFFVVRKQRFPIRPPIERCPPPNSEEFPDLHDLTAAVEEMDFEHVIDAGWRYGELRHFYRLFYHPQLRVHAAVCLAERTATSFYYLSLTSFSANYEKCFMTWNYPFSYGLFLPKGWNVVRVNSDYCFEEMLAKHKAVLEEVGCSSEMLAEQNPEHLTKLLQELGEEQVRCNVEKGILSQEEDGLVRYSGRGLFFLWWEFLRDLFKIS